MPDSSDFGINWQLWCRLCAKDDRSTNINLIMKKEENDSLPHYLYKYFGVQVEEAMPQMLCTECFAFVTDLVNFAKKVESVQSLFQSIINDYDSEHFDNKAMRIKFDMLEKNTDQIASVESNHIDKITEINQFEKTLRSCTTNPQRKTSNALKRYAAGEDVDFDIPSGFSTTKRSKISDVVEDQLTSFSEDVKLRCNIDHCSETERSFGSQGAKYETKSSSACFAFGAEKKGYEYFCTECSKTFKRDQHLRQHMKRIHSKSPVDSDWTCPMCPDRIFSSQYQFNKHQKIHLPLELKRILPCPYCNKKFSTNGIVQNHIKYIHNNDRSFICDECGITMRTNAALKAHMLTHTDYAPFECSLCKKKFKSNIRLRNHMETHDPRKHICAECGLQLNSRATLSRHLLVHSDVMLHKCDYCGRAFKRAKALKSHLILHTGLRPYSCDFCDKTFANGSNCRSHKKKSHPKELAALEASGKSKPYTRNIPKLETLKAVTKTAGNLAPVASKQSGCFSSGKKPKGSLQVLAISNIAEEMLSLGQNIDNSCHYLP